MTFDSSSSRAREMDAQRQVDAILTEAKEWVARKYAGFALVRDLLTLLDQGQREREGLKDAPAVRSAAKALLKHSHRLGHTEAVSDCLHCNALFLARWTLSALGPEPEREQPPGPADPPCRHMYADLGFCIDCGKKL